jgi:hypothetical protein
MCNDELRIGSTIVQNDGKIALDKLDKMPATCTLMLNSAFSYPFFAGQWLASGYGWSTSRQCAKTNGDLPSDVPHDNWSWWRIGVRGFVYYRTETALSASTGEGSGGVGI